MGPNPSAGQGQGGGLLSFLPLVLIFVIFYFMLIRPQQKKAKEHKSMLENLEKGTRWSPPEGIRRYRRSEDQYSRRKDRREREGQIRQALYRGGQDRRGRVALQHILLFAVIPACPESFRWL
jgi:hypothetical protein